MWFIRNLLKKAGCSKIGPHVWYCNTKNVNWWTSSEWYCRFINIFTHKCKEWQRSAVLKIFHRTLTTILPTFSCGIKKILITSRWTTKFKLKYALDIVVLFCFVVSSEKCQFDTQNQRFGYPRSLIKNAIESLASCITSSQNAVMK